MAVKIRERPKGSGIWWILIDHQGKRKAKKIGRDKRLAREVAKKIEAKLVLGQMGIEKEEIPCPTFREYAEVWLALPHKWKESTLIEYRRNLKKHVYPDIGNQKVKEIRRKDLKQLLDKLLIKGMASETVSVIRAATGQVLAYAVETELIENNPMRDIKIECNSKQLDVDPLTEEETTKLLDQAKVYLGGIYYPPMVCGLRTGMRIGEIQALQWGDIDFNGRFIEVKRSWRNGRITGTKSKKRRRVDITPHLSETLQALRVIQKRRALKDGRQVSEWVFANERGKMLHRKAFRNGLNRCLGRAGLRRVRIHDLRHSYATIRLLRGHNVGDVCYQLGHSSIKITYDIYGHWIPGKFKSEVDELDHPQPSATYTQRAVGDSSILKPIQ